MYNREKLADFQSQYYDTFKHKKYDFFLNHIIQNFNFHLKAISTSYIVSKWSNSSIIYSAILWIVIEGDCHASYNSRPTDCADVTH